ncbi:SRPBCC family protein [Actinomadura parmotrematis]|uniref:SRPBCC family protein n=1 Tax=Actinomadura parmotrematis TaxID=2864039 RepID=A0ABS7G2N7_9ACTN|nr:SRPBCC family protein [Actinomadura parmotrematis]MBW8486595.1 SRPBCC family protein [Actinomadura parmotrematis]
MEYESERAMPADSRTVFDVASDASALGRWLPADIHVHAIASDLVEGEEAGVAEGVLMRVVPDQLRLEWGTRRTPDYTGWLQVADRADGASSVTVHLSFLGDHPQAHPSGKERNAVQAMLEESLGRLADVVTGRVARAGR